MFPKTLLFLYFDHSIHLEWHVFQIHVMLKTYFSISPSKIIYKQFHSIQA